jgi:predicted patatin/cPLA2 family phospholipase
LRKTFDTIILEGGSLRCSFTAGILDVLLDSGFPEFENYYGVSSGSMAMSYFIAKQRKNFVKVSRALVEDSHFLSYTNTFSAQGLMNLDFLEKYVRETFPFDEEAADLNSEGKNVRIITTDKLTGKPYYLRPSGEKWINYMLASGTLPFITKGKTMVDGTWMFDGGYSDPIPVREAIKQGSKNILVIRTRPSEIKIDKSYTSLMAEYWNYDNEAISDLFHNSYKIYNDCVDFLSKDKPDGVDWHVLAPAKDLRCDGYYLYKEDVDSDYRMGLEVGLDFINSWKKGE